jgi:hypothetical protein
VKCSGQFPEGKWKVCCEEKSEKNKEWVHKLFLAHFGGTRVGPRKAHLALLNLSKQVSQKMHIQKNAVPEGTIGFPGSQSGRVLLTVCRCDS